MNVRKFIAASAREALHKVRFIATPRFVPSKACRRLPAGNGSGAAAPASWAAGDQRAASAFQAATRARTPASMASSAWPGGVLESVMLPP